MQKKPSKVKTYYYAEKHRTIEPGDIAVAFLPRSIHLTNKKEYVIVRITRCGWIGVRNDLGTIEPYCPDNFWFKKVGE
jgi:hypothetical protein